MTADSAVALADEVLDVLGTWTPFEATFVGAPATMPHCPTPARPPTSDCGRGPPVSWRGPGLRRMPAA
jgi:hypothetical protein